MSNLLPLAVLVKFTEINLEGRIPLGCYFRTTRFIPEEKHSIAVDEWLVSFWPVKPCTSWRSEAPALIDACANMINLLLEGGFNVPELTIDIDAIITHSDQTELLVLQFQELILEKEYLTFSFQYWPSLTPPWIASLTEGNHWNNTDIAEVRDYSLYDACSKLMKQFRNAEQS